MIDFYTAVVFIIVFLLFITAVTVFTNRLVNDKMKHRSIVVCVLIGIAILCEWIGVKTNGNSAYPIALHKGAKLIEFCLAPAIAAAAAIAYGKVKKEGIVIGLVVAHIVFECVGMHFGWVFRVDEANIYHREKLYWIYIAAFSALTIYCFVCIVRGGREYQEKIDGVLILTLCMLAVGIGIQMLNPEIRVDFACVAIGNVLLYNHYCNTILQVDMVTRLLNRRCYERKLERLSSPAVILIFDINRFKSINDTFGHTAGDICLREVAKRLQSVYGRYGFCYRIGGDEFCVILNKNLDNLQNLNRQFKDSVEYMCSNDKKMSDVALGYAYYDAEKNSIQKVIQEADDMMYKNKR